MFDVENEDKKYYFQATRVRNMTPHRTGPNSIPLGSHQVLPLHTRSVAVQGTHLQRLPRTPHTSYTFTNPHVVAFMTGRTLPSYEEGRGQSQGCMKGSMVKTTSSNVHKLVLVQQIALSNRDSKKPEHLAVPVQPLWKGLTLVYLFF